VSRRRALIFVPALVIAALVLSAAALGYYSAKGSGTAEFLLGKLNTPTISAAKAAAGGTVALTWASASGPENVAYYVTRNGGAPGGTCPSVAEPVNELTGCVDEGLEPGTYTYKVTAKYKSYTATSAAAEAKVTVGPAALFVLAVATTTPSAGASDNLTITAKDKAGSTVTTYTGEHELSFEGAEAIGTNKPTVSNNAAGTAVPFGTATGIKFTAGVATVSGSKNGVMKLYRAGPATISVSDGSIESEVDPTVTVAPLAMKTLLLEAEKATPTVGEEDALTVTAKDTYGNLATGYAGSKSLKYSGPVAGPNGNLPTVTDKEGNEVAIGTGTPTEFVAGVATVQEGDNGALRLYKAAAASLKATEGSISSNSVTVTAAPAAATALKVTASSSTPTAGSTDNITTTALDGYGNTATSYTGSHNITFGGPEASPSGTAATVSNSSGTAVNIGTATTLTFTSGVASVTSTKNGVLKPARSGATGLTATDGSISTAGTLSLTVAAGTAARFAWSAPTVSVGTLSSPCLFTCTITNLGNGNTFKAKVAVTDSLGNVVSNLGTGHSVAITATSGTITGSPLTIAETGLAESTATVTYTSKSSGTYTDTIKAEKSAGTAYTAATATASK
jgi:hypothetical protein